MMLVFVFICNNLYTGAEVQQELVMVDLVVKT